MAILKCKMCGGDIELAADKTFGTCEFCGNTMTLPKVSDEQRAAAFNRGNHFRRTGEFDKALAVYERIVQEDDTDAEAHWCCALCRFGIEYVEDPATFEWLPTCHRASFDSFLEDVDYLAAVAHSEGVTRRQYQREAMKIAEVQRGILATSQNTEPYDVFICYKESDANGDRTRDSMLAQDVYYQLTDQGLRVFFARITLEDVAGTQYEPYIFAALNSAKVMTVITTSAENVNAVWVKNEWSRFLALMRKDRSKLLLPCYRDMDPYDLPEALSVLQSYDMSKIGFIQDLVRGIKKVLNASAPKAAAPVKETVVINSGAANANIAPLLKRAFMFLEDGDWARADEFCEQVLNQDPECAEAYLGKLMAELKVKTKDGLRDAAEPFDGKNNYSKAMRFGDDGLKNKLNADIEFIKERNETARLERVYFAAKAKMARASSESDYKNTAAEFATISHYKDAAELRDKCINKAEYVRKTAIYDEAQKMVNLANRERTLNQASHRRHSLTNTKKNIQMAIEQFRQIPGWRDADEQVQRCLAKIKELDAEAERLRIAEERNAENARIERERKAEEERKDGIYSRAQYLARSGETLHFHFQKQNQEEAIKEFKKIPGWRDADEQVERCLARIKEIEAEEERQRKEEERQKEEARIAAKKRKRRKKLIVLGCVLLLIIALLIKYIVIPNGKYNEAVELLHSGNPAEAYEILSNLDYKNSAELLTVAEIELIKSAEVGDCVIFGSYEQDNNINNGPEDIEWIVLDIKDGKVLVVSRYAIDCEPYNTEECDVTWETCTLRQWLNDDFINSAFTPNEKEMIPVVTVSADKNPEYKTYPGKATQDQVFLLSVYEANEYDSNAVMVCVPTAYAVAKGAYVTVNGGCYWWLRSPGVDESHAVSVSPYGEVSHYGGQTDIASNGVRPAMWIDISE